MWRAGMPESGHTLMHKFDAKVNLFSSNGISIKRPEFYNDSKFLELERHNPTILEDYAEYVNLRPRNGEYEEYTRSVIEIAGEILYQELIKDASPGRCADVAGTLLKIIERFGIWAYIINGSLRIDFPPGSPQRSVYFWVVDVAMEGGKFGHAWLVAPPFIVIDLTVRQQGMASWANKLAAGSISGIQSREVRFLATFPASKIGFQSVGLYYVPYSIRIPDGRLEDYRTWKWSGRYALELFNNVIEPAVIRAGLPPTSPD